MHYRNGKEAKNGDKIVQLGNNGEIVAVGVLHSATPGNDYCNGYIAPTQHPQTTAAKGDYTGFYHNPTITSVTGVHY